MNVSIEYCQVWNYKPKAVSLAEELQKARNDIDIEFIESSGGAFEIVKDGKLIYSKLRQGSFPDPGDILDMLD